MLSSSGQKTSGTVAPSIETPGANITKPHNLTTIIAGSVGGIGGAFVLIISILCCWKRRGARTDAATTHITEELQQKQTYTDTSSPGPLTEPFRRSRRRAISTATTNAGLTRAISTRRYDTLYSSSHHRSVGLQIICYLSET